MEEEVSGVFYDQPNEILAICLKYFTERGCGMTIRLLNPRMMNIYDEFAPDNRKALKIDNENNVIKLPYKWLYDVRGFIPSDEILNSSYSLTYESPRPPGPKMEFERLMKNLKLNNKLKVLNLSGNYLGSGYLGILIKILNHNKVLTSLNLENNAIGDRNLKIVSKFLKKNNSLTYLNLGSNQIDRGVGSLASALKYNNTLKSLDLNNNYIGYDTQYQAVKMLAQSLTVNTSLKSLDLSDNFIEDEGAISLANSLGNLTSLNLEGNHIKDAGAVHLASVLETNRTLTFLNLESNEIGDIGANSLVTMLYSNPGLELKLFDEM